MTKRKEGAVIGRPAIFPGKTGDSVRVNRLTPTGSTRFEQARKRLAKLAGWEVEDVSDADCIEFLALGETATIKHLEEQRAKTA
jgi:hypothetical protein